jgi:hypothetical protein
LVLLAQPAAYPRELVRDFFAFVQWS